MNKNFNYIFVDESGEPGKTFKINNQKEKVPTGASLFYILSAVCLDSKKLFLLENSILKIKNKFGYRDEIKSINIPLELYKELLNIIKGFHFIAVKIIELKPEYVMFLGDFYHVPEFITTRTLHASHLALMSVKNACIEVRASFHMMPGNHDVLNEQFGITSINNLIGYSDILKLK